MDAQAYLIRHGWSGPGNPLNPNSKHHPHGGLGLTRPILVSRKNNNHGVGKKTTKDPTNQWWLRGFEDALKGVGSEQRDNGGASSANALTSELYRFFVRGEVLEGTIRRESGHGQGAEGAMADNNDGEKSGKGKRKRVDSDDDEVKEAKMRKKEKKREEKKKEKHKEEGVSSERCSSDEASKEDKEERRRRKEEKRKRKAEDSKDDSKTKSSSKAEKKKKEKRRRKETLISAEADYPTPASTEQEQTDSSGQDESAAIGKTLKEKKDKKHKKESKKSKKLKTDENADPGLSTSKEPKEPKKAKKEKKDKKKKSTSD